MGLPQEEACRAVACQDGRTAAGRPAGVDLPEGRMAEGACPEAGPMQPEDLLQDTVPNLTAVAEAVCYNDIPPHASWHQRLLSCIRGAAHEQGEHRQGSQR